MSTFTMEGCMDVVIIIHPLPVGQSNQGCMLHNNFNGITMFHDLL